LRATPIYQCRIVAMQHRLPSGPVSTGVGDRPGSSQFAISFCSPTSRSTSLGPTSEDFLFGALLERVSQPRSAAPAGDYKGFRKHTKSKIEQTVVKLLRRWQHRLPSHSAVRKWYRGAVLLHVYSTMRRQASVSRHNPSNSHTACAYRSVWYVFADGHTVSNAREFSLQDRRSTVELRRRPRRDDSSNL
jgi:hypothetical protein